MKINLFLIIFIVCGFASNAQDFFPQYNQTVHYTYDPKGTKLEGEQEVEAVLYIVKNRDIESTDLTLSKAGNQWKTSFKLPDSTTGFALRFKANNVIDNNNDKGYVYKVYKGKEPVPFSHASQGILYQYMARSMGLSSKTASALSLNLYDQEILLNPGIKDSLNEVYYRALVSVKKRAAFPVIEKRVDSLVALKKEAGWKEAIQLCSLTGNRKRADSLKGVMADVYGGAYLYDYEWSKFETLKDPDSMYTFYKGFKARYKDKGRDNGKYMLSFTVYEYINKEEYAKALDCLQLLENPQDGADLYNGIAKGLLQKGDITKADNAAEIAIKRQQLQMQQPRLREEKHVPLSEIKARQKENYGTYLATLAAIKARKGNMPLALKYQQEAVQNTKGRAPQINENYITWLMEGGDNATAAKAAAEFVKSGQATSGVRQALLKILPSHNAERYVDSLEAIANQKQRNLLAKDLINKTVSDFALPALDRDQVTLASLKGKVVVLDFWATWCGPCKASFPGMQQTVERYRKDTSVAFLFVDTWESMSGEPRLEALRKFLKDNKYSFNVLLDQPLAAGGKAYRLTSDFGVEGIPTKFVLDKKGNIRFMAVGFLGDSQHLENELSNMIEVVKTL